MLVVTAVHYIKSKFTPNVCAAKFHKFAAGSDRCIRVRNGIRLGITGSPSSVWTIDALSPLSIIGTVQKGGPRKRAPNTIYLMLGWQATVAARKGEEATARAILSQAITAVNDVAGRAWEAETHHLRGKILLTFDPTAIEAAHACFSQAMLVARKQDARSLELRAANSLAESLRSLGREREGHDLLAPVYDWFTEGFDTADLKDAKALLEGLN
jgi:hypothetical protein